MQNDYMKIIVHSFDQRKIDAQVESEIFEILVIPLLFLNVLVFSLLLCNLYILSSSNVFFCMGTIILYRDLCIFSGIYSVLEYECVYL